MTALALGASVGVRGPDGLYRRGVVIGRALVGLRAIYDVRFLDGATLINVDGGDVVPIQLVGEPERQAPPRAAGRPVLRVVRT
mgnify:CR=1 FL=1